LAGGRETIVDIIVVVVVGWFVLPFHVEVLEMSWCYFNYIKLFENNLLKNISYIPQNIYKFLRNFNLQSKMFMRIMIEYQVYLFEDHSFLKPASTLQCHEIKL